jgi:Kef-type K+ transport system membrane component KefB
MTNRLLILLIAAGCMLAVSNQEFPGGEAPAHSIMVLGFLLIAAYCIGYLGEKLSLPRITGYILAGLLLGPYCLGFIDEHALADLGFLNNLALAFIAFCAGGELHLKSIRERIKSISLILAGNTLVILTGVTGLVLAAAPLVPFMKDQPFGVRLAMAAIIGVVSATFSPAVAMAQISELRARGGLTDTVLTVTIATDVVVILLFGVVVSFCHALLEPAGTVSVLLILNLLLEILITLVLGFLLGRGIIILIRNLGAELPIIIAATGFLVIKSCHMFSDYLYSIHEISLHLEPLLICMAAGFTVQNFSGKGESFLISMDRVSLPIYVGFFAVTGAMIDLEVLRAGWLLGLLVFASRGLMVWLGSLAGSAAAGDPPAIRNYVWLGFITQAGVSLGLVAEVVRRFPEIGLYLQSILIAAITANQVIGPVLFKYSLRRTGEAKR